MTISDEALKPRQEVLNALDVGEQPNVTFREYYEGKHETQLTERMRRFLQLHTAFPFRANYCSTVADALDERLRMLGLNAPGQEEVLWNWWKKQRADYVQGVTHLSAIRDGDAYVIVSWDHDKGIPKYTPELAFDGTSGMQCVYDDDDRMRIAYAFKVWNSGESRRLNVYYPEGVERWICDAEEEEWYPFFGDEDEDGLSNFTLYGAPTGVPVVHFRNKDVGYGYGRSELDDVIPLQDATNKSLIDLLAAGDTTAFRIMWMLGDDPSDLKVGPGQFIFSLKPPGEVSTGYFPGEDLTKMIDYVTEIVLQIARVSRTPISYFQITKQRPAAATLRQEEQGLIAKARKRIESFSASWEQAFEIARTLWNEFGEGPKLDPDVGIETLWEDPGRSRGHERMLEMAQRMALHVPVTQLWLELGYAPEVIAEFVKSAEYQAFLAGLKMAITTTQGMFGGGEEEEEEEDQAPGVQGGREDGREEERGVDERRPTYRRSQLA